MKVRKSVGIKSSGIYLIFYIQFGLHTATHKLHTATHKLHTTTHKPRRWPSWIPEKVRVHKRLSTITIFIHSVFQQKVW